MHFSAYVCCFLSPCISFSSIPFFGVCMHTDLLVTIDYVVAYVNNDAPDIVVTVFIVAAGTSNLK